VIPVYKRFLLEFSIKKLLNKGLAGPPKYLFLIFLLTSEFEKKTGLAQGKPCLIP